MKDSENEIRNDENSIDNGKKYKWCRCVGGLITFSTILPLKIYTSIDEMAKVTWTWPFIGALMGLFSLVIAIIFKDFLNLSDFIIASVIYGFMISLNGFHHLDGLLDFGDALMAHGSVERKIEIMKDPIIGTGGISLFFIVALITIACLHATINLDILLALVVCEMSAKLGIVTCATTSKAQKKGTGRYFIKHMSILKFFISSIASIIIGFLLLKFVGVIGVLGGILGGSIMAYLAHKNLNSANGDILGASNEIGRMFSLLLMIISFSL